MYKQCCKLNKKSGLWEIKNSHLVLPVLWHHLSALKLNLDEGNLS